MQANTSCLLSLFFAAEERSEFFSEEKFLSIKSLPLGQIPINFVVSLHQAKHN
jgi:hypothetical protein